MRAKRAVGALSALAQETRLAVFRMLVRAAPEGVTAGAIAERLRVPPATLSFHLAQLEHARLVNARRRSRNIFYTANVEGIRDLLAFLTDDCCQGRPELCDVTAGSKRNVAAR
jgi:DNA-binding transcriptional ArsR family regulator